MKRSILSFIIVAAVGMLRTDVRSQDPEPAPAPAPALVPVAPIPNGTPLEMLKAIRDANAKLLERQAATLLKLEEMEKSSQAMKILGKRS
jgi:hypothetical protein